MCSSLSKQFTRVAKQRWHHYLQSRCSTVSLALLSNRLQKTSKIFRQAPLAPSFHLVRCSSARVESVVSDTTFGLPRNFQELYDLGPLIGKGGFGVVHHAVNRATGTVYAVKTLPKRFGPRGTLAPQFAERVRNEIDVYRRLGSSLNVAFLYGAFEDDACVRLVVELCSGGALWDRMKAGRYTEADAAVIMREVMRVIAQCHAKSIVLRDCKYEHCIATDIANDAPLKAVDFGAAQYLPPGQTLSDKNGTLVYLAPEAVRGKYDWRVDNWAAGIIAYLLLLGTLPFTGEEGDEVSQQFMSSYSLPPPRDVFRVILYAPLAFDGEGWQLLSDHARDFVMRLLQRNADERMSAQEALAHPWLTQTDAQDSRPIADTVVQRLQRFGTFGAFKQRSLGVIARYLASPGAGGTRGKLPGVGDGNTASTTAAAATLSGNGTAESAAAAGAQPESVFVSELEAMWEDLLQQHGDNRQGVPFAAVLQGLRDARFDLTTDEIAQLLEQLEVSPGGWVSHASWLAAMVDWREIERSVADWDTWVAAAFRALDRDGDDVINRGDLEQLLCGEEGCEGFEELENTLRLADADQDGVINLQEFQAVLHTEAADDINLFETRLVREHEHRP